MIDSVLVVAVVSPVGPTFLLREVAGFAICVILNKNDVWYVCLLLKLCLTPHTLKTIQRDGEIDQCTDSIDTDNMESPLREHTQE